MNTVHAFIFSILFILNIIQNIFFYVSQMKHDLRLWINYDRIFIFGCTVSLTTVSNLCCLSIYLQQDHDRGIGRCQAAETHTELNRFSQQSTPPPPAPQHAQKTLSHTNAPSTLCQSLSGNRHNVNNGSFNVKVTSCSLVLDVFFLFYTLAWTCVYKYKPLLCQAYCCSGS